MNAENENLEECCSDENIILSGANSAEETISGENTDNQLVAELAANQEYLKALKTIMELGYLSKDELRLWLWLFASGGEIVSYQRQIARELRMTRSSLSKALKRLVGYGIVCRTDLWEKELPGLPAKIKYVRLGLDLNSTIRYASDLYVDFENHVKDYTEKLKQIKIYHLDFYDKKYDINDKNNILEKAKKDDYINTEIAKWYLNNFKHSDDITSEEVSACAWETIANYIKFDDETKYGDVLKNNDKLIPLLPYDVYEAVVRVSRRQSLIMKLDDYCFKMLESYRNSGYYLDTRNKNFGIKTGTIDFESIPLYINSFHV